MGDGGGVGAGVVGAGGDVVGDGGSVGDCGLGGQAPRPLFGFVIDSYMNPTFHCWFQQSLHSVTRMEFPSFNEPLTTSMHKDVVAVLGNA